MAKAVLISIQPRWCELIANATKTVEVRKTKPKLETPFKVYIYCTRGIVWVDYCYPVKLGRGKVIGEFVCDEITVAECGNYAALPKQKTMLDELDLLNYADEKTVYGWHISNLVLYDKPKELSEFHLPCIPECDGLCEYGCLRPLKRPPQSWCYVERLGEG